MKKIANKNYIFSIPLTDGSSFSGAIFLDKDGKWKLASDSFVDKKSGKKIIKIFNNLDIKFKSLILKNINQKELLDQVDPVTNGASTVITPSSPKSTPSAVKEMQSEMQIFIGKVFPQLEQANQKSRYHSEYGIGDFLTTHYESTGYERFADPRKAQQSQKAEDVKQVLESMRNIGSRISTTKPDGLWGQRTQLAIKNIAKLSYAVLEFAQAIDFTGSFTKADVDSIGQQIPDSANPLKDRTKFPDLNDRASKISDLLKKLNSFTDSFQKHLTTTYGGQFTESEEDSAKIQRFKKIETSSALPVGLDDTEKSFLRDFKSKIIVDVLDGYRISINLDDGANSIIEKLTKAGLQKSWIDQNFDKFIESARAQVIEVLKSNNLLMTREKETLVKEISDQLKISRNLIADIGSILGQRRIRGARSKIDYDELWFKQLYSDGGKDNIFNLNGLNNHLKIYNEETLKETLNRVRLTGT